MFWINKIIVQIKSLFKINKLVPIIEGENSLERVSNHLKMNGYKKIVILTGKNALQTEVFNSFVKKLERDSIEFDIFDQINKQPNIELAQKARVFTAIKKPDAIVAVGPTGVIEVGKIVSASAKTPQKSFLQIFSIFSRVEKTPLIVAPSVTGGAVENCDFSYIIDNQNKKICFKGKSLMPNLVVLDPLLNQNISQKSIETSAFECFAKALESFTSSSNIAQNEYSKMAIKIILDNLEKEKGEEDFKNTDKLLKASYLASVSLNQNKAGYAFELANQINAKYNINMAQSLSLVLVKVLNLQKHSITGKLAMLSEYCNISSQEQPQEEKANEFLQYLEKLIKKLEIKPQITLENMDFKSIVDLAVKNVSKSHAPAKLLTISQLYDILEELREI